MEVPMKTQFKEQQCNVVGLALGWIGYAVGMAYFTYQHQWVVALLWMASVPGLRWALYHFFPRISRFLGYGRIADTFSSTPPLRINPQAAPVAVNFYSFFSCPFCPIVLARLQALQKQMGFSLTMIDVTLKPQTLVRKGIMSVPVVEMGDHRLVGNSTTEQLAALIARGQVPELLQAS
jgi:thiol-disulfide isomerase/thioredoxin